jgi:DNA-binding LytR/AlgR family response regulator
MSNLESKIRFTFPIYIIWIIAEVVIISLFYTFFTVIAIPSFEDSLGQIMFKAVGCMILIMALPYTILTLYAAYKSKTEELQLLQYELSLTNGPAKTYPSLVNLYDYNGTLKLTINSDSLYYIESQDNYVKIYYENQEKLLSYMLRCRTKAIEENLADTSMVRCHRSYMVNLDAIKVLRREKEGVFIELGVDGVPDIPISKTYAESVNAWLLG